MIKEPQSLQFARIITRLSLACDMKNKKEILSIYDEAKAVDIDSFPERERNLYDALVDKANDILYS